MDNAKQHWKILQELGSDLENRVRSFLVIGKNGDGVIVTTENGNVFWMGKMEFVLGETRTAIKPTQLDVSGVVHMAQSQNHILLLNNRGQIYEMGGNNCGQLSLGYVDNETRFSPQLISISHKFTSVRCGLGHSLALTEDGKVWAWGTNHYGQIGVLHSNVTLPFQILELDSHRIVAVECSGIHSLALTNQGEVYIWRELKWVPTRILTPSRVKSITSGYFHTLLLTQTGEVYACGDNRYGQLGLPTTTKSSPSYFKVAGLPSISQIASHHATNLSIAMSSDQRCFVWGELSDGTSTSTPRKLPSFFSTVESPLSFYSLHRYTPHSVLVPETPSSPLYARMSRMFDNPETSDVQFVVEHRTIHAHRIILSNSSDYFARMFSERPSLASVDPAGPIVKVTILDHFYDVFHAFLRFLYTDCFEVHPDLLPELFQLAIQYLESDLQQLCLSRMRATITPVTCCIYYPLTFRHSLPELAAFQQELAQFASNQLSKITNQSMKPYYSKKLRKLVS